MAFKFKLGLNFTNKYLQLNNYIKHILKTSIGKYNAPRLLYLQESLEQSPQWDPLKDDGILYAVPKKCKSYERRIKTRYGRLEFLWQPVHLVTCVGCGKAKEPRRLCPHCYGKIDEITKEMQESMVEKDGLSPVDKEKIFLFQDEKVDSQDGLYEGKKIIEVDRKRPNWFSQRLLQNTNITLSESTAVAETSTIEGKIKE